MNSNEVAKKINSIFEDEDARGTRHTLGLAAKMISVKLMITVTERDLFCYGAEREIAIAFHSEANNAWGYLSTNSMLKFSKDLKFMDHALWGYRTAIDFYNEKPPTIVGQQYEEISIDNLFVFDRDLNRLEGLWLSRMRAKANGVPSKNETRIVKSRQQETTILNMIDELGYLPLAMPKKGTGVAGVKSEVCKRLKNDQMFDGVTVFNKAWERLAKNGEIKYTG